MPKQQKFLCVGAPKCATTTLYEILKQHPQVGVSSYKEPNFFSLDSNYTKGMEWYSKTYFSHLAGKIAVGEITPIYFYHPQVPARVRSCLGSEVKFIVMVRDPVERAFSQYQHNVRDNLEHERFERALFLEQARLNEYRLPERTALHTRFAYRGMSSYAACLGRYLEFFPLESFFFIVLEMDFFSRRAETVCSLLRFLGVDDQIVLNVDIHENPASQPRLRGIKQIIYGRNWLRSMARMTVPAVYLRQAIKRRINRLTNIRSEKPVLSPDLKCNLRERFFAAEILQFEQMIHRSLEVWRS